MKNKIWSSRFTKKTDAEVLEFSQSLGVDIVLDETESEIVEYIYRKRNKFSDD